MPQLAHRPCWHRPGRTKRCITCGEEKLLGEFYAHGYTTGQGKRGTRYESRCKPCAAPQGQISSAAWVRR